MDCKNVFVDWTIFFSQCRYCNIQRRFQSINKEIVWELQNYLNILSSSSTVLNFLYRSPQIYCSRKDNKPHIGWTSSERTYFLETCQSSKKGSPNSNCGRSSSRRRSIWPTFPLSVPWPIRLCEFIAYLTYICVFSSLGQYLPVSVPSHFEASETLARENIKLVSSRVLLNPAISCLQRIHPHRRGQFNASVLLHFKHHFVRRPGRKSDAPLASQQLYGCWYRFPWMHNVRFQNMKLAHWLSFDNKNLVCWKVI